MRSHKKVEISSYYLLDILDSVLVCRLCSTQPQASFYLLVKKDIGVHTLLFLD